MSQPNNWQIGTLKVILNKLKSDSDTYKKLLSIQKQFSDDSLRISTQLKRAENIFRTPFKVKFNRNILDIKHLKYDTYKQKCTLNDKLSGKPSYLIHIHTNNKPIKKHYEIYLKDNPMNVELRIASLLNKDFTSANCVRSKNKLTPLCGILTPIAICYSKIHNFRNLPSSDPAYDKFIERIVGGYYDQRARVSFYHMYELSDTYITKLKTVRQWKIFIFQVLFILAKIHETRPTFKHNELKLPSIAVFEHSKTTTCFELSTQRFKIPQLEFSIQLTDFYMSQIPGTIESPYFNNEFWEYHHLNAKENKFSDMYYFLSTIRKYVSDDVLIFVEGALIGTTLNTRPHPRFPLDCEPTTPQAVLKCNTFFDEFRL